MVFPPVLDGAHNEFELGPGMDADEEFRSASDVFGDPAAFDFLSQHGGGCGGSSLTRESLYVRFDPLIGGRPSILPANPRKEVASSSVAVVEEEDEQECCQDKDLISMQSPSPKKDNRRTVAESETPSNVEQQQSEWRSKLQQLDSHIVELEKQIKDKLFAIESLKTEVLSLRESEEQMKQIIKQYEKTMSELIVEKETERANFESERRGLEADREQALEDLRSVEIAFTDVHSKYERTKEAVAAFKQNEETLKKYVEDYIFKLKKAENKYQILKEHAENTLEKANREIENVVSSQDADLTRLKAVLKRTELKSSCLERELEQKLKENVELSEICDDLVSKVK